MPEPIDVDEIILNFDPAAPHGRFRPMPLDLTVPAAAALPQEIPWPDGAAPIAAPVANAPVETDDLSRSHGYDAVVVT
jgi:hypothetical protein